MPFKEELPPLGKSFVLEYDKGDSSYPVIGIVRDPRAGEGQSVPNAGASHPDAANYPNHVFVGLRTTGMDTRVIWLYKILPGPELDGARKEIPRMTPERFIASETITTSKQSVPTGTAPDTPSGEGGASTVGPLSDAEAEKENRSLALTVATALSGFEYDDATGLLIPIKEELVTPGSAGTALQSDGTYAEVHPYNPIWSIKTTRKATTLDTRSYAINRQVSLPRVLTSLTPISFTNSDGSVRFMDYFPVLTDYSGVYPITVEESWQSTAFTDLSGTLFRPQSFSWSTPYASGGVPECLHGAVSITGSTGTDDPTWGYIVWDYSFAATTPSAMPSTVVIMDIQQPWKGGYLRRKETISI